MKNNFVNQLIISLFHTILITFLNMRKSDLYCGTEGVVFRLMAHGFNQSVGLYYFDTYYIAHIYALS
jgi:hypothetical protein